MSGELPRHEPHPELFVPLLARFELTPGERRAGRLLLALVRVPGARWLLLRWHARRGRRGR
jgi:hypothetical protein